MSKENMSPEVRWGVGCLVAAAAVVGAVILTFLVALALTPPEWVQVLLGVGLALGGALLAWLVAASLGRARQDDLEKGPRPVAQEDDR